MGIPLAVLGVLPILWNAGNSIWIRRRLGKLLPSRADRYVSTALNPTSGSVALTSIKCELKWRKALTQSRGISLASSNVGPIDPNLHGGSWMGLLQVGISPSPVYGGARRTIVDSTLRIEVAPMQCDWETFVFITLGLGVDVRNGGLQELLSGASHPKTLRDESGQDLLDLYHLESSTWIAQLKPGLSFSWQRALAVASIAVTIHEETVCFIALGSLTDATQVKTSAFHKPPQHNEIWRSLEAIETSSDVVSLATTWVLYWEDLFRQTEQYHYVPQWVHYARDIALDDLQSVIELRRSLDILFPSNDELGQRILDSLNYQWNEPSDIVDGKTSRWCRRDLSQCPGYVDIGGYLTGSSHYKELLRRVDWRPWNRAKTTCDVNDLSCLEAILARVILCTSMIQCTGRGAMFTMIKADGRRVTEPPREPLLSLLWDDDGVPFKNGALIG